MNTISKELEEILNVRNILWRVSRMRELLKREASKQKKNECL
jgi:hypothetical protein